MKLGVLLFSLSLLGCCLFGRISFFIVLPLGFTLCFVSRQRKPCLGLLFALLIWQGFLFSQDTSTRFQNGDITTLSGLVISTTKRTAFVLQDNEGKQRYVTHKDKLQIGDRVSVKGYITVAKQFGRTFLGTGSHLQGFLQSPLGGVFDYPAWLAMKGYEGAMGSFQLQHQGTCISCLSRQSRSVLHLIQEVQRWRGDSEQAGLLLGLLIGHRGMINKQTTEDFTQSSLVHLIAVSGGNLLMIASLLGILLFRLPLYIRFFVIGIAMILYGLLCGFDSSVVRALIMAILGILAIFLGKPTVSRRLITIAFLAMLLWNPLYLLYDLGFQLSFMAVVGIILFQDWFGGVWNEKFQDYKRLQKSCVRAVWSHMLVSLGAFSFTLPVLFLAMGKINLTGLLSNILIVPLIPLLQIGGFVSTRTSEWIATQEIILWMVNCLIGIVKWTQEYGVQIIIEELRVKWLMILLWSLSIWMIWKNKFLTHSSIF